MAKKKSSVKGAKNDIFHIVIKTKDNIDVFVLDGKDKKWKVVDKRVVTSVPSSGLSCDCVEAAGGETCAHIKAVDAPLGGIFIDPDKGSITDREALESAYVYGKVATDVFDAKKLLHMPPFEFCRAASTALRGDMDESDFFEEFQSPVDIPHSALVEALHDILRKAEDSGEQIEVFGEPKEEEEKEPEPSPVLLTAWGQIDRPDPSEFYVDEDVWHQTLYAMMNSKNLMYTGPSGSGKTTLVDYAAKALGANVVSFNMGAMSEPRASLIGNTHLHTQKGTFFQESRFVSAIRGTDEEIEGKPKVTVVLLDELSRAGRDAFNILLPLLDKQGYLALDESEDAGTVEKAERGPVCFVATANLGMEYTGTDALDVALNDRFGVCVDMTFPPPEAEKNVLLGRCEGLPEKDAQKLVDIAILQRTGAVNGDFIRNISTRMLIEAGEQVAAGFPLMDALKYTVLSQYSDDGGDDSERTKVLQICQKGGLS